jgi:single-strand DNA-binding protein
MKMANFNKVMLLGNLTRDPELRYLPSQTAVVEFGLAINRKYKGQDGSIKDETCFVDCQIFGKPAEVLNKYCRKGNPLFVEGRLKFESWTKQDGSKASKLRVTVETFQFLGSQNKGQTDRNGDVAPEEPVTSSKDYVNEDIPFDSTTHK